MPIQLRTHHRRRLVATRFKGVVKRDEFVRYAAEFARLPPFGRPMLHFADATLLLQTELNVT